MELALCETVAVSIVRRILFCGGVLNSWVSSNWWCLQYSAFFLYLPSSNSESGCCKSILVYKTFKLILPPDPGSSLVFVPSGIIQMC
jgi:hypothetical protein